MLGAILSALDTASRPIEPYVHRRPVFYCLINDAIAFGELEQLMELFLRRIGIEFEPQPDLRETNRRVLGNAERTAEIEIAFGRHRS